MVSCWLRCFSEIFWYALFWLCTPGLSRFRASQDSQERRLLFKGKLQSDCSLPLNNNLLINPQSKNSIKILKKVSKIFSLSRTHSRKFQPCKRRFFKNVLLHLKDYLFIIIVIITAKKHQINIYNTKLELKTKTKKSCAYGKKTMFEYSIKG